MRKNVKISLIVLGAILVAAFAASPLLITAYLHLRATDWVKLRFSFELPARFTAGDPTPTVIDIVQQRLKPLLARTEVHPGKPGEIEVWIRCTPELHQAFDAEHAAQETLRVDPGNDELIQKFHAAQKAASIPTFGSEGPNDIIKLLNSGGVLDFRIAVDADAFPETSDLRQKALASLPQFGPAKPISVGGIDAAWFKADPPAYYSPHTFITDVYRRDLYILLYNDVPHTLCHNRVPDWSITAQAPIVQDGIVAVPFSLDNVGGSYMNDVTAANTHAPLAILLGDSVISAPTIHTRIYTEGEITFAATSTQNAMADAQETKRAIDAGVSPIRLHYLSTAP